MTCRSQPYRLDPPVNGDNLPQIITNADEMFQILFEDVCALEESIAAIDVSSASVVQSGQQLSVPLSGFGRDGDDGNVWALGPPDLVAPLHGGTGIQSYTLGDTIYASGPTTLAKLAGNTTSTQKFLSQTGDGTISAVPSWQTVPSVGSLVFFFKKTASSIATYFEMSTPASVGAAQTFVHAGLVAGNTTLENFATVAGVPNLTFVPAGVCTCYITAEKTGTKDVVLFAQFYQRNLAGTETLLATSANSFPLTALPVAYIFQGAIPSSVVLLSSDRLVTRVVATVAGSGSAPDVTLTVEGVTAARSESPSATVDATNFVPYSGATANVDLGTKTLTTPTVIGGTGTTSTLTLKATSGVGTTNSDIIFQVGNNGALETMRLQVDGRAILDYDGTASALAEKLIIRNTTLATALSTIQVSPRLMFRSNGWTGAASNTVDFVLDVLPTSSATPSGNLRFGASLNGAARVFPVSIGGPGLSPLAVFANAGAVGIDLVGRNNAGVDESFIQFFRNNGSTLEGYIEGLSSRLEIGAAAGAPVITVNNGGAAITGTLSSGAFTGTTIGLTGTISATTATILANAGGTTLDLAGRNNAAGEAFIQFFKQDGTTLQGYIEGITGRLDFADSVGVAMSIANSKVGLGQTNPTAYLHIKAGTASANTAPIKLTAGTLLTTPEIGTIEFTDDGTTAHLYVTVRIATVVTRVQIA